MAMQSTRGSRRNWKASPVSRFNPGCTAHETRELFLESQLFLQITTLMDKHASKVQTCRAGLQETGRRASTLTLKWRHRGSGWGRSSSSCPTPTPLLNPQLGDPSQVGLLGTTLMALLKKNISEPFQLTLLNIGVTNFVGAKGTAAGGVPLLPLFSSLNLTAGHAAVGEPAEQLTAVKSSCCIWSVCLFCNAKGPCRRASPRFLLAGSD